MATIKNLRNSLLYAANSTANGRLTGAYVSISPGAATSLLVPKGSTVTVPSSVTLTASASGYITPAYSWSYRFGTSGSWIAITGTTNTLNLTLDAAWLTSATSNTVVQYLVSVTETASGFTAGINQSQYILSIPIIREGADGFNNLLLSLYYRTATNVAPTVVTTGQTTYSFNTGTIVGQPTGWTKTIPDSSSGAYLWVIQVQVASTSSQYTFANTLWSSPVLYTQNGTQGTNGLNTDLVYLYARNNSISTAPTLSVSNNLTYDFTTGLLTGTLPSGWTTTVPVLANGAVLWTTTARVSNTSSTDTILPAEWTTPKISGAVGERGTKTLYSSNSAYSANWVNGANAAGPASYAAKATELIAAAAGNSLPTTPLAGDTVTFSNTVTSTYTGSIGGYVLSVSAISSGTVQIGQTLTGSGILAGTTITSFISGTNGGIGTYGINRNQTVASTTITATSGDYVYTITYNGTSWNPPGTVVDGSLLVTGSVTASKINTNGLDIRDANGNVILAAGTALDFANVGGSTKPANNATVGADSTNLKAGTGVNLVANPSLRDSISPWYTYINTGAGRTGTITQFINSNGAPAGYGSVRLSIVGNTSTTYDDSLHLNAAPIPCTPGERLELQAKVQIFRGNAQLQVTFLDSNNTFLGSYLLSGGTSEAFGDTAWSTNISDFVYLWGFSTVPSSAIKAYIEVRVKRTQTTQSTDLYVTQPYIGRATAIQTTPSPWVDSMPYISGANASTYIANAAIGSAQIGSIALVGTSNFSVKTATSGARMEMDSRFIKVYDSNGTLRVQLGDLSL